MYSPHQGPGSSYRAPERVDNPSFYGVTPTSRLPPALMRRPSTFSNVPTLNMPPPMRHTTIEVPVEVPATPAPDQSEQKEGWFSRMLGGSNTPKPNQAHLGETNKAYHDGTRWVFPGESSEPEPVQQAPPPIIVQTEPVQRQPVAQGRYVATGFDLL